MGQRVERAANAWNVETKKNRIDWHMLSALRKTDSYLSGGGGSGAWLVGTNVAHVSG
jgi:hypothetical protein